MVGRHGCFPRGRALRLERPLREHPDMPVHLQQGLQRRACAQRPTVSRQSCVTTAWPTPGSTISLAGRSSRCPSAETSPSTRQVPRAGLHRALPPMADRRTDTVARLHPPRSPAWKGDRPAEAFPAATAVVAGDRRVETTELDVAGGRLRTLGLDMPDADVDDRLGACLLGCASTTCCPLRPDLQPSAVGTTRSGCCSLATVLALAVPSVRRGASRPSPVRRARVKTEAATEQRTEIERALFDWPRSARRNARPGGSRHPRPRPRIAMGGTAPAELLKAAQGREHRSACRRDL